MATPQLQTVQVSIRDRVGWLTLNRPRSLNAWTRQLGEELLAALSHLGGEGDVRAIVITGAGRAFSAGADLREGGEVDARGRPDVASALRQVYNPLICAVRTVPKPVVAAVNGPAVGIGCSLALACDMLIASEDAYFLLAFVNIGLGLDGGASLFLPAMAGPARAFQLAYTGERLAAEKALSWGLVNEVVAAGELEPHVHQLAARFAAGPPGSFAAIKRAINASAFAGLEAQLELETELQQERARSQDFLEGVTAFMQKRPASFSGS